VKVLNYDALQLSFWGVNQEIDHVNVLFYSRTASA